MGWEIKSFDELIKQNLYSILKLRSEVFVVEQNCIYNDLDDLDFEAFHLYKKEAREVVAYARILPAGSRFREMSIGRVLVNIDFRGKGIGKELMQKAIKFAQETRKEKKIRISAQEYLKHFYLELGFVPDSDLYLEDGIPHLEMVYED